MLALSNIEGLCPGINTLYYIIKIYISQYSQVWGESSTVVNREETAEGIRLAPHRISRGKLVFAFANASADAQIYRYSFHS